jgi:hypothetical protein
MPALFRVVLDTNVLLAGRISHHPSSPSAEILDRWQRGEFTALYSLDTLAEYAENLLASGIAPGDEVGRMSNKGLVVAIRDRVVRVIEPDGRNGFVVCDDMSAYVPNSTAGSPAVVGSDIAKGMPAENGKALYRTGAASDGGLSRGVDPLQAGRVAVPVDGPPSPPFGTSPSRGIVWVPVETAKPPEGAVGKSPDAAPWYLSAVPNW